MLAPRLLLRTGETVRDIAEAPATDAVVSIVQPRFKTFPKYLMLKLQRYFIDREWKQRKIDVSVPMPEHLDLSAYLSSGLQPGEVEMPASSSSSSGEELSAPASAGAEIAAREAMETEIAVQLMSMGFEEIMCRRAARAVCPGGDVEAAMNWLLEHIDDGDIRDPLPPLAAPGASAAPPSQDFDEETVAMLMSLGYSTARVTRALRETGGDPERAADWLFSHIEGEDDEVCVLYALRSIYIYIYIMIDRTSYESYSWCLSAYRWMSMHPPSLALPLPPPQVHPPGATGCWRSCRTWAAALTTGTTCATSAEESSGYSSTMTL
jgi:hypothetical protein